MTGRPTRSFQFRITGAGVIYLVLTLAFGLQAVSAGNNLLFLLFAVMAGFGASLAIVTAITPFGIRANRHLPEEAYAGDNFTYTLQICSIQRWRPVFCLQVSDHCQLDRTAGAISEVVELDLSRPFTLEQEVISPRRGWLVFDSVRVRCHFPFGLFTGEVAIRLENRLLVYPQKWILRGTPPLAGLDGGASALNHANRFGAERAEFAGLREFQAGDHPRHIQWHASGRLPDQILARQFEPQHDQQIIIALDSFYPLEAESRYREALEDNICLAQAMIEAFLLRQFEVVFAGWSGTPCVFHLNPFATRLGELRNWLAAVEPDHQHGLADLLMHVKLPPQSCAILLRLPGAGKSRTVSDPRWRQFTPDQLKAFIVPQRTSATRPLFRSPVNV